MDNRTFIEKLIAIKEAINKQIPLASNRFEEFEQCALDADQDEIDKKFFQHEIRIKRERFNYYIFQEINLIYEQYCEENKIQDKKLQVPAQIADLRELILSQSHKICSGFQKFQKHLGFSAETNCEQLELYLTSKINEMVETLCSGAKLEIEDKELAERFRLDHILGEHRHLYLKNNLNIHPSLMGMVTEEKHKEKLLKTNILFSAMFLDQLGTTVGFCGEHASLALKRILEQEWNTDITIEKISISYEEGDGHTFLAINRVPGSKVNDISSWGKNAILFDAWNKLVCWAEEFNSQPVYYFSYPDAAKWEVEAKFTYYEDMYLLKNLNQNEENLIIAGHDNKAEREQAIFEEYNLVSVKDEKFPHIRSFIEKALPAPEPGKNMDISLFITSGGVAPIQIVFGLPIVALAVHKDYLEDLVISSKSDEFVYGLAWAIKYIKHFPLGGNDEVTEAQASQLDNEVVKAMGNGLTAINYLRYCIEFINQHNDYDDVQRISIFSRYYGGRKQNIDIYNKRIKNLMTILAIDDTARKKGESIPVSAEIMREVKEVNQYCYFTSDFDKCKSNLEKINYLIKVLPELRKELLPYEVTDRPCARLREYCHLLSEIPADMNNHEESVAINNLIDQAFDLRIPGFDRIYRNALRMKPDQDSWNYANRFKYRMQPLGIFRRFQIIINEFVQADTKEKAVSAARQLFRLDELLKNHMITYSITCEAQKHINDYKKAHKDQPPTQYERFFGSTVGSMVNWRGFESNHFQPGQELPWSKYFAWVDPADGDLLPKTLWRLGVIRDPRLFRAFSIDGLFKLIEKNLEADKEDSLVPLIELQDNFVSYGTHENGMHYAVEDIIDFLASQHQTDHGMLENPVLDLEEKFRLFYDRNKFCLMSPTPVRNAENGSVIALLTLFKNKFVNGTEADKKLVKDFFLKREDKRDLEHLLGATSNRKSLKNLTSYIRFYLEQEFGGDRLQLYDDKEAIQAYKTHYFEFDKVNPLVYLRMFGFQETRLTLEIMIKLVTLLIKNSIRDAAGSLIASYLAEHRCNLLSNEVLSIAEFTIQVYDRKSILEKIVWELPPSYVEIAGLETDKLIILYRAYDELILFPSFPMQQKFGRLIIDKIKHTASIDERIAALESLLFLDKKFHLAINDLDVRNEVIAMWCKAISDYYGVDDGTQAYFDKFKVLIDKIISQSPDRDKQVLLVKLSESVCSQMQVSEYIGLKVEPEKYIDLKNKSAVNSAKDMVSSALDMLAGVSELLTKDANDQMRLLNFLSEPLSPKSSSEFALYLSVHPSLKKIAMKLDFSLSALNNINYIEMLACVIYHLFWDRPMQERSLAMNYLLIPAEKMATPALCHEAYKKSFDYVVMKLFPDANNPHSDDHLAKSFLKAYLDCADEFSRAFLLAGMLVASNEGHSSGMSVGKKLVLLCEHMGPAYVKLAQAIHSHPSTPAQIREDLKHIKARANPPTRWQLCRMIDEILLKEDKANIKYIGRLLGSASYNLALDVELQDGSRVVLSLLRENAAKSARDGFDHLKRAVLACDHPRIIAMRETVSSLIEQAQELSLIEMDQEKSAKQYAIASEIYQHTIKAGNYSIHIHPSKLIKSGKGYRFIEQVYGEEFNEMVNCKSNSRDINLAAEAVTAIELLNILRASHFDSDRHGNQLRIRFDHANQKIFIGLYDFGEMSLEKPDKREVEQFANVLNAMDYRNIYKTSFSSEFERQLSKAIETMRQQRKPVKYLMHIRKGVLALQDFHQHVPPDRLMKIFQSVAQTNEIHPVLQSSLSTLLNRASYYNMFVNTAYKMLSLFNHYPDADNEAAQFHITREVKEPMTFLECDQNILQSPARLLSRRGECII